MNPIDILVNIKDNTKHNLSKFFASIESPIDGAELAQQYLLQYSSRIALDISRGDNKDELVDILLIGLTNANYQQTVMNFYLEEVVRQLQMDDEQVEAELEEIFKQSNNTKPYPRSKKQ